MKKNTVALPKPPALIKAFATTVLPAGRMLDPDSLTHAVEAKLMPGLSPTPCGRPAWNDMSAHRLTG